VDDNDLAGAIAVRMGVFFGGATVRGPASVAYAVGTVERIELDDLFQVTQFALGAADLKAFVIAGYCNACRIISPIFEATQAVNDDRDYPLFTDITDDTARLIFSTRAK